MCLWQVTKKASQKKIAKRSRLKAFTKVVNYNHIMPTRYVLIIAFEYPFLELFTSDSIVVVRSAIHLIWRFRLL
jgi:capsule polysaccharide export protein KpsE/RkpR